MSEVTNDNNLDTEEVTHDEFLHRALLRKRLINEDTRKPKPDAFFRRRDEEGHLKEEYLSVDRAILRSSGDFVKKFNSCHGIVGLYAWEVRNTNLDVVPMTKPPNDPSHAGIIGCPDDAEDTDAENERLAGLLAKQAVVIWP
jgi:hypothetical protein